MSSSGASGTNITVINDCAFTVWPGILSDPDPVLNITGFELTEGASRSLQAPVNWSGLIWGRTGCTFNGSGPVSCATGDCGSGEMECNGRTFNPPVTIANINTNTNPNTYDVSIMNGYNLPMTIEMTGGKSFCRKTGCVEDLIQLCPPELKLEGGGGCKSACQVFPSQYHCCTNLDGGRMDCSQSATHHMVSCSTGHAQNPLPMSMMYMINQHFSLAQVQTKANQHISL